MEKELYNSHIKRVLNRYRVHHFSTDQPLKAQIVKTMLDLTQHFFHLLPGRSIKIMKPRSMNYSTVNISDSKKQNINIPLETT